MIYRLKAPTRQDIEEQIPFELYRKDEDGNDQPVFATEDYSYKFLGHYEEEEAVYEEGEMVKPPVISDYVLADLMDWKGTLKRSDFEGSVEILTNVNSPIHGWK